MPILSTNFEMQVLPWKWNSAAKGPPAFPSYGRTEPTCLNPSCQLQLWPRETEGLFVRLLPLLGPADSPDPVPVLGTMGPGWGAALPPTLLARTDPISSSIQFWCTGCVGTHRALLVGSAWDHRTEPACAHHALRTCLGPAAV